jgi:putative sigma-54 modulation protein
MLGLVASAALAFSPTLHVTGSQNLQLTDPLRTAAVSKLEKPLERFAEVLNPAAAVELHLKVEHLSKHDNQHIGREAHIAEITAYCKDKSVIRATAECEDMYASLDDLSDVLTRKLRKHKERKADSKQAARRGEKAVLAESLIGAEDDEDFA